jgi:hypothetical protein
MTREPARIPEAWCHAKGYVDGRDVFSVPMVGEDRHCIPLPPTHLSWLVADLLASARRLYSTNIVERRIKEATSGLSVCGFQAKEMRTGEDQVTLSS